MVFNLFPILYFLSWSIAKKYFDLLQEQDYEVYLVVGLIMTLILSAVMSTIRIIYIVWMKIKMITKKYNELKAKRVEKLIKKEKHTAQL